MKALSLTQPWASMVAIGYKQFETRSWSTSYRGPLAIHASKGFPRSARDFAMSSRHVRQAIGEGLLPGPIVLGHVIAVAWLVDVRATHGDAPSEREAALGNWQPGRFAFELELLGEIPIEPARGSLGLWEWQSETDVCALLPRLALKSATAVHAAARADRERLL